MPLGLIEDAFGDARNAQTLAWASDCAYYGATDGKTRFAIEMGMVSELISVGNTQAWIAAGPGNIVVAFRGTESPTSIEGLKDWLLTDAMNLLIVPEGQLGTDLAAAGVGARFHQGFVDALAAIFEPVYERVQAELNRAERPLWITGHSLGGALALLAGWMFSRRMIAVHQIYTFGGPMIGNGLAIAAIDRELAGKIFRYVNRPDPIPTLPMMSLLANQYAHCRQEFPLGEMEAAAQSGGSYFQSLASQTVSGILSATLIDDVWRAVNQLLSAHAMENYRRLVGKP